MYLTKAAPAIAVSKNTPIKTPMYHKAHQKLYLLGLGLGEFRAESEKPLCIDRFTVDARFFQSLRKLYTEWNYV